MTDDLQPRGMASNVTYDLDSFPEHRERIKGGYCTVYDHKPITHGPKVEQPVDTDPLLMSPV